jgi:hypothetical protein
MGDPATIGIIAASIGAVGNLAGGAMGSGGSSTGTAWIKPPKEAIKTLESQAAREAEDIKSEGARAASKATSELTSAGLGGSTFTQSFQNRIGRDTAQRLADLGERTKLISIGGYNPYITGSANYGPFAQALGGLGQQVGAGGGLADLIKQIQGVVKPEDEDAVPGAEIAEYGAKAGQWLQGAAEDVGTFASGVGETIGSLPGLFGSLLGAW